MMYCQAFVSEYAVHGKDAGSGSLLAALAEASFLIGLEKNRYICFITPSQVSDPLFDSFLCVCNCDGTFQNMLGCMEQLQCNGMPL